MADLENEAMSVLHHRRCLRCNPMRRLLLPTSSRQHSPALASTLLPPAGRLSSPSFLESATVPIFPTHAISSPTAPFQRSRATFSSRATLSDEESTTEGIVDVCFCQQSIDQQTNSIF